MGPVVHSFLSYFFQKPSLHFANILQYGAIQIYWVVRFSAYDSIFDGIPMMYEL